jgi:hypothetical protein
VKVGDRLDDFDLLLQLGRGAFAKVFLARQRSMHRLVALKVSVERGVEAQTLAQLDHPHIVRVFDQRVVSATGLTLLYMSYLPGGTLKDVITWMQQTPADKRTGQTLLAAVDQVLKDRGETPPVDSAARQRLSEMSWPETVCWLGARLAEALDYAHRQGVLHRDIKPANIYVREKDGSLVLLDFGAARYASSGDSRSLTSIVTPGYAPFEQYHTHGAQGPWSDLYAFGGVLYWTVTGEKPLEAPSRVRNDTMLPAAKLARGRYSERLLRAIDWALTPDEADRPKSVSQLKAVLTGEAAAPPPPLSAVQAGQAPPAPPKTGSRLPLLLAAAGVALLAIVGLVFYPNAEKPVPPAPGQAAPAAAAAEPPPREEAPQKSAAPKPSPPASRKAAKAPAAAPAAAVAETAEKPKSEAAPPLKEKEHAAAPSATVVLNVTPEAEVVLDGRNVGKSPPLTKLTVSAGVKHRIEIHGAGVPHFWTVELQPGEKRELRANFEKTHF